MNEQELRDGLREVMAASSQPPPMNPATALDAAKRAHKRRKATWAGAGAGATVVALAAGIVFTLAPAGESLPIGPAAATGPETPQVTQPGQAITTPPPASSTEGRASTSLPSGQTDRTARNGPRSDAVTGLLTALTAALPDTLAVDTNRTYPNSDSKITSGQASFENFHGADNTQEAWQYLAIAAVTRKAAPQAGTGRVLVTVFTPGVDKYQSTDVCVLTPKFWGVGGTCTPQVVQGRTVGVITKTQDARIDNVVGLRHDDGTVVFVAQSKAPDNEGAIGRGVTQGAMTDLPLTVDQLSQMVLNPAFKVK